MGTDQFAWDYDLNMASCQVALFVTLALFLQCQQLSATDCNRRTTFIQIRIPQRTNVAVKYPKEIKSAQYVPFPYLSSGSQCIKCQDATCNKCSSIKPPSYSTTHARKTNIVIDIKGTRKLNVSAIENAPKNSTGTIDGTIVGIYDRTSANSKSGATASTKDKGNSSAATASGTSSSQIDTVAAINEVVINKDTGEKSNVEDIYAASEDGSTADANSTAAGDADKNEKPSKGESGKTDESSDKKSSDGGKPGKDPSDSTSKSTDEKKTSEDNDKKSDSSSDSSKPSPADKDDKDKAPTEAKESDKDKKSEAVDDEESHQETISDADSNLDKSSTATATARATTDL